MNYQIDAPGSAIRTTVKLPASKSISNRALILNALSYSAYDVENLSDCDDTNLMVKALNSNDRDFNVGAAGTDVEGDLEELSSRRWWANGRLREPNA